MLVQTPSINAVPDEAVIFIDRRMTFGETKEQVRAQVEAAGGRATDVIDRFWFKSVYFLEPGGVLFELATDGPGFAVDEDPKHLGESLVLPPWLESQRATIVAGLPSLTAPQDHDAAPFTSRSPA
jgi:hypothetical protein